MGTHPIFESDFDCLTEWDDHILDRDHDLALGKKSKRRRRSSTRSSSSRGGSSSSRSPSNRRVEYSSDDAYDTVEHRDKPKSPEKPKVEMPPDPLVARAGSKFDSVTGPRDRWMAEHPYKPEWHQEEQARRKAEYGLQTDMTLPGGQDPRIPQGFRGGPNPFRGGFRGGRGGGRGRGDPRNHPSNQGDIASRRRNYTMGIPDPNRPRNLTGIPELDKEAIEKHKQEKETPMQKMKREREENETPEEKEKRLEERAKRKRERKKERLLQEQKHIASVMGKPLHFIQSIMKGEVPEDLTEEPPPPIPDRVDPPFHHKFKDAMNAAYRIKFPRSFFLLYEFMSELNKEDPLNELVKNGMQMVGPYEELHKCYTCPGYIPDPENYLSNHMRYRYYYDPPELLTCIISIRDHWHVGLFCDYPHETPSICASNDQRTGALYSVAANLFGAVKIVLYRRTQTLVVRSMYEAIIDFCERHEVDFNRKTPDFKRRDMLIVNKTVNEVGFICEDYNGFTDEKEEEVAKLLKTLKKSHNEEMTKHNIKPIKGMHITIKLFINISRSLLQCNEASR